MENNEIQDLKNQLAALQNQLNQLEVAGDPERSSRRGMMKLAAGAAAGVETGDLRAQLEAAQGVAQTLKDKLRECSQQLQVRLSPVSLFLSLCM